MSEKILKDITKYDGSEKFQYFRETLVDEVSENFSIIEEKLKKKNFVSLSSFKNIEKTNESNYYKYIKYDNLNNSVVNTIIENFDYLYIGIVCHQSPHITSLNWYSIDLTPYKNDILPSYSQQNSFYFSFPYDYVDENNITVRKQKDCKIDFSLKTGNSNVPGRIEVIYSDSTMPVLKYVIYGK